MECAELAALRQEATALFRELVVRRRRAREHAAANSGQARIGSGVLGRGDFEGYLQRRLGKSAARIEGHLLSHGCQV